MDEDRLYRLEQRIDRLENGQDIADKAVLSLADRVRELEEWQLQRRIAEAREDERDKALYDRLDRFEKSLKEVASNLEVKIGKISEFGWRIFWIAATPLVTGLILVIALGALWFLKIIPAPKL